MKSFFRKLSFIIAVALVVFVLNAFFGDALAAKVSTWSWVEKYHLVDPRAPLVINTREEVRINEANDIISVISRSRNKVAAVVDVASGTPELKAAALAVTADGIFLTSKQAVGASLENLRVVLSDGKRLKVLSASVDPVTNLAALKTDGSGLGVASFVPREDLSAGKRVVLLAANADGSAYVLESFLSSGEQFPMSVVSSDSPARFLPMQSVNGIIPGHVALDLSGQVAGVWDGSKVVSAPVIEEVVTSLFAASGKITHPVYGFNYRFISSANTNNINGLVAGFKITAPSGGVAILPNSAAAKAGLLEGDVITKVGDQEVASSTSPEALLTGVRPAARLNLEVMRAGKAMQIEITPN